VLCAIAASGPLQESQRKRVLRRRHLIVEPQAMQPAPYPATEPASTPSS